MKKPDKIRYEIRKATKEANAIYEQMAPLQKRVSFLNEKIRKLQEQKDEIELAAMKPGAFNWADGIKRMGGHSNSMTYYKFFQKKLREEFDMSNSGYYPDTNEVAIQIQVAEKDSKSLELNTKGVKHFTKIYTPHPKSGMVMFGILEKSLSANGIYYLLVDQKTEKCQINRTTYGRDTTLWEFESIDTAMNFISLNLPSTKYDLPYEERSSDDDHDL